jgi:glyoxylase-like metal-dependent hydrolase (beta-lactamase superfamily II)
MISLKHVGGCACAWALLVGPVFAQSDFSGNWAARYQEDFPERIPGPELGDYLGLPITDGARQFAESWDASRITLEEEQCRVHVSPYIYRGPINLRIWEERDPDTQELVAIKHTISTYDQTRTIYMDGRPHPSANARHTWMGFSTGEWQGDMLVVKTTHLKQGWHRRNGIPMSDRATMTEFFSRIGDVLTRVSVTRDPVYLTEALIKSEEFTLNARSAPAQNFMFKCKPVVEVADRPKGTVPAYQLGENPFLKEFSERHKVPLIATRGGADTMYPEFEDRLRAPSNATTGSPSTRPSRPAPAPSAGGPPAPGAANTDIETIHVQGSVHMLAMPAGNSVVQIGDQGVFAVDAPPAPLTERVFAAIRRLAPKPIHYIVNTNVDASHAGGNAELAKLGPTRLGAAPLTAGIGGNVGGATGIIAHENVLARMTAAGPDQRPQPMWPTETYSTDRTEVFFNGEAIQVMHPGDGRTDGDSIVFFRRSDVIVTGDSFTTTGYPRIDLARGGSVNGVIAALNQIIDLAVPDLHVQEGGTLIVPGQGRLCDEQDVIEYRDMVTIVRDRIQYMVGKGFTLAQVIAARPTLDFDARYGSEAGPWTTAQFIEAVYRGVSAKPRSGR